MTNLKLKLKFCLLNYFIFAVCILTFTFANAYAISALDPLYLGGGARPLGMGKAYVALAEDGDGMFLNPAGLGRIDNLKLTSMYANLLGDVKYTALGVAVPTQIGSFGLGYVGSRVDDILIFGSALPSHYPSPTAIGSHSDSVLFLSYGLGLNKFLLKRNLYLGANLKYFLKQNTGVGTVSNGNGSGFDLDLGLIYEPLDWMSAGLNYQNVLPQSLGGQINYSSGLTENIPAILKLGTKFGVLGKEKYSMIASPLKLDLTADVDLDSSRNPALHLGVELWPVSFLALRAGLDQDPVPATVDKTFGQNLTLGLGLRVSAFEFNYAYHPYSTLADNTTHFFSLGFIGFEKKHAKAIIIKPADRLITYDSSVEVVGQASAGIKEVEINGNVVNVGEDGRFSARVPLKIGKNLILSRAYTEDEMIMEDKRRILRLAQFSDVTVEYWAKEPIEFAATAGLVEGYPDGTFKPDRVLSRAEMTTLLVRIRQEKLPEFVDEKLFRDMQVTHWATKYIEAALKSNLVEGYPDGTFRPDRKINRAEGVTVSTRFDGIDPGKVSVSVAPFSDISRRHWAAGAIVAAKEKGLIEYLKGQMDFFPKRGLTRAESVVILTRTDRGHALIEELLDWDRGYGIRTLVIEQIQ